MRNPAERFGDAAMAGLLWLWLCNHLRDEWTLNPQYNYGWAVPFLAAFLFLLRWANRPPAEPTNSNAAAGAGQLILLASLLPIRAIEEANPDWRLLSWTFALIVVGYSLLALKRAGGGAWVCHFAFPICLPLVAVPWPVKFENVVVQGLTRAVAYAAVEIAGWIGVGAFQRGNVIELHNGLVGIDEACSGVKTLQAAIMVSLVLGELLQFKWQRRTALVLVGCAWVFVCNVLRATTLVIIAAGRGIEALHRWHDPIGTAVLIAGMAGLLLLGWLLAKGARETGTVSLLHSAAPDLRIPISLGAVIPFAWLLLAFAGTEFWYRAHEQQLVMQPAWEAHWPNQDAKQQEVPITDTTRAILRYDQANSAAWADESGGVWWGFFARWEPARAALQLVRSHSPEICLPAAGRTFRGELAQVSVDTAVAPLVFRAFEFEQNRQPLFVFVCIQEDKTADDAAPTSAGFTARSRLLAVLRGQRNLGQRLLELAVIGLKDEGAARQALERTVGALIAPAKVQSTG